MKQSPSPQHHSPAALRWPPRMIQLSWADVVSGTIKSRVAKTSASRARLRNMGTILSVSRQRRSIRSTQALLGFPVAANLQAPARTRPCSEQLAGAPANQPLDLEL